MITYTEKGCGLHEAIRAAGHWLRDENGVWVSSDNVAVQAIIDGYTLDQARTPFVAAVKELARVKILAFLPEWKQSNINARMNELNEARFSRALTTQESAEIELLRGVWSKAKAIRAASDVHEQRLASLQSFSAVSSYDIYADWPAG